VETRRRPRLADCLQARRLAFALNFVWLTIRELLHLIHTMTSFGVWFVPVVPMGSALVGNFLRRGQGKRTTCEAGF
jgi:hypothetical protein